jgi:pre-rRNA-processing protein RIX1
VPFFSSSVVSRFQPRNLDDTVFDPMASSQHGDTALTALRALAFRLSSTSGSNLVPHIPHIGSQISPYKVLLSSPQAAHSEAAAVVHQLRTRTSSLLQDRSPEARLAAVVVVKALVEAGGYETLANNGGAWVRGLIAMISRQDSTANTTRKLAIITVTRIIELAKEHDGLSRDIATPNLPPFVTACLTVLEGVKDKWGSRQRALLETILRSWAHLIPRHPATFRPFIGRILKVLGKVIEIPGEETEAGLRDYYHSTKDAARTVYILLHNSATKSGSLADRDTGFKIALKKASSAINETAVTYFGHGDRHQDSQTLLSDLKVSRAEELCDHIHFVAAYIATPSFKPVTMAVGKVSLLLQQISSITLSSQNNSGHAGKKEREQFLIDLPRIHLAVLELVTTLISRYGTTSLPLSMQLLDSVLGIHDTHQKNPIVRGACYKVTTQIIQLMGPGMSAQQCKRFTSLIHHLSSDLLSALTSSSPPQPGKSTTQASKSTLTNTTLINTSLTSSSTSTNRSIIHPSLHTAATALLPALLRYLPASALKRPIRAILDRTAVLTQNADALVASTLNVRVGGGVASLLPIAVRCERAREGLESVIRPRVPVGLIGRGGVEQEEEGDVREGGDGLGVEEDGDGDDSYDQGLAEVGAQEASADVMDGVERMMEDDQNTVARNGLEKSPNLNPARKAFEQLEQLAQVQSASKHSLDESEEVDLVVKSPSKRTRFEPLSGLSSGSKQKEEASFPIIEQTTGAVRRMQPDAIEKEDESDDDDDSDFEIPALVLATGHDEDDEDDDDKSSY